MCDYSRIYYFWIENPKYWISIQNKEQADLEIYSRFQDEYSVNSPSIDTTNSFIGYIIYLDQFQRHFTRYLRIDNDDLVYTSRDKAAKLLDNKPLDFWLELDEQGLYFCLMPYKHLFNYIRCLQICNSWTEYHKTLIRDNKILSKFYNDTYAKAYTIDLIYSNINTNHPLNNYNPVEICDFYPHDYSNEKWLEKVKTAIISINNPLEKWRKTLDENIINHPVIISLSGGVDSMVILLLLKALDINAIAVHIIYGNRAVSQSEYSFVATYCNRLSVPLYSYSIQYLRRDNVERDFYESMTRDIRFNVYKSVGGIDPFVILGHIKDDVVENIWTNFSNCQHLDNLKKMSHMETQSGVVLFRPFLDTDKNVIYNISRLCSVPYLKNTTPSWSNRGKFRENFYGATHAQFGGGVDNRIIRVAELLESQSRMLDRLVYSPILDSYDKNRKTININRALEAKLDLAGWQKIIEILCHEKLGISKPSIHSIEQFIDRIKKTDFDYNVNMKFQMKSSLQFNIYNTNGAIILKANVI
jgi:tRNA(Ile)-lysidine synthetase-like protein